MNQAWYKVTSAPSEEPVTLAEASLWAKIDSTDDNDIVTSLIKAARLNAESYTRRGFVTQTVVAYFDGFYDEMILNRSPISAITSVKYYDGDDNIQTLATTVYDYDIISEPGIITLGYNQTWPTTYDKKNAVEVTMTVGYGAASTVPEDIKTAIKMILTHLYENRQDVIVGRQVNSMPQNSEWLLEPYRVWVHK